MRKVSVMVARRQPPTSRLVGDGASLRWGRRHGDGVAAVDVPVAHVHVGEVRREKGPQIGAAAAPMFPLFFGCGVLKDLLNEKGMKY